MSRSIPGPSWPSVNMPAADVARRIPELRTEGVAALRALADTQILAAWSAAMRVLRDPSSPERQWLDPLLVRSSGLSRAGLAAALEVVLGGADGDAARRLVARSTPCSAAAVTLVILASNLPGLAVQALLPALARRRPLILKSSTAEPHLAIALHRSILAALPGLASSLLTTTWEGGDRKIEDAIFPQVERIVLYGGAGAVADVIDREPSRVMALGPRVSFAVIARECDPEEVAAGLARDVALFDQRGCLSVQAIYTDGDAGALAGALASALQRVAVSLPPGPPRPGEAAAVHRLRLEAEMRGLDLHLLDLAEGTVVVEPRCDLLQSPGLRTVRIHPLPELVRLPVLLEPGRHFLQGVAMAGEAAWALRSALTRLGATRFSPPGELQHADVSWRNGGIDPLELVAPSQQ